MTFDTDLKYFVKFVYWDVSITTCDTRSIRGIFDVFHVVITINVFSRPSSEHYPVIDRIFASYFT